MTEIKSVHSLLKEISNGEEYLRKIVTLPKEFRQKCDEFYESYHSDDTSIEEKEELEKFKGFILAIDVLYPMILTLSHFYLRIKGTSFWDSLSFAGRNFGKKATMEEAFIITTNYFDDIKLDKLPEYLELGVGIKQSILEKDKQVFTQLLETTNKKDDFLYGCGMLQTYIEFTNIWGEIFFGDYAQSDIDAVQKGYLLPTIMRIEHNLYHDTKDYIIDRTEFFPYELAKKHLRCLIKIYFEMDKEMLLDYEIELIEEAAAKAQNFEDAFYPVYFSIIIEKEGNLNGYIDYWIDKNGDDCGEVKLARSYMNQLTLSKEDSLVKSGRKQGCWLKGKPIAEEHSWAIKIQTKVWDKTLELARSFDYVESLTEKKAEKKYKEMAAALLYKSAEIIGVADLWDSGVQSSYERTMSFAKIDRRYLKKYLDILDYYLIAKEFQIRENHFLYRKNEYDENIIADYQEDDDDRNFALSIYQSRTKHIFPSANDMKQLRERRAELIQSLADSETMANFISINFKAIGSALSIVKQIMKKIK